MRLFMLLVVCSFLLPFSTEAARNRAATAVNKVLAMVKPRANDQNSPWFKSKFPDQKFPWANKPKVRDRISPWHSRIIMDGWMNLTRAEIQGEWTEPESNLNLACVKSVSEYFVMTQWWNIKTTKHMYELKGMKQGIHIDTYEIEQEHYEYARASCLEADYPFVQPFIGWSRFQYVEKAGKIEIAPGIADVTITNEAAQAYAESVTKIDRTTLERMKQNAEEHKKEKLAKKAVDLAKKKPKQPKQSMKPKSTA